MSPDTAAKRPDQKAAERPANPIANRTRRAQSAYEHRDTERPGRHEQPRSGRMWTVVTVAAAAAFTGALVLIAAELITDVDEVSDTPERSVASFLSALLDDADAAAAGAWLCEEKADRDLTEATAALADLGEREGIDWSNVQEVDRGVGRSTVTADLATGGDVATWSFTLVAEDADPQWLVCGLAVE